MHSSDNTLIVFLLYTLFLYFTRLLLDEVTYVTPLLNFLCHSRFGSSYKRLFPYRFCISLWICKVGTSARADFLLKDSICLKTKQNSAVPCHNAIKHFFMITFVILYVSSSLKFHHPVWLLYFSKRLGTVFKLQTTCTVLEAGCIKITVRNLRI